MNERLRAIEQGLRFAVSLIEDELRARAGTAGAGAPAVPTPSPASSGTQATRVRAAGHHPGLCPACEDGRHDPATCRECVCCGADVDDDARERLAQAIAEVRQHVLELRRAVEGAGIPLR